MGAKRIGKIVGVVIGVYIGMKYLFPVTLPIFLGWLIMKLIKPQAEWICKMPLIRNAKIKKDVAGSILIFIYSIVVAAGGLWLIQTLIENIRVLFEWSVRLEQEGSLIIGECCERMEEISGISGAKSKAYICEKIGEISKWALKGERPAKIAVCLARKVVEIVSGAVLSVVFAFLLFQEEEMIEKWALQFKIIQKGRELLGKIKKKGSAYLKAQLKIMGAVMGICIAGLLILGCEKFWVWGVLLGFFDAFPVLGTGTFLIPAAVVFMVRGEMWRAVGCLLLYFITAYIRQFLEPRLVGEKLGISPFLFLVSVYLGIFVYGAGGVLLGPLSAFLIYEILKEWLNTGKIS